MKEYNRYRFTFNIDYQQPYTTMKLHLPLRLFRVLMVLMAAAPSALFAAYTAPTEIKVPDTYINSVTLSGAAEITTQTEATVYRLTDDVSMTPKAASLSGASYLFTSDAADKLASLTLTEPSGSTSVGMSVSSQVGFDSLKDVSFTAFTSTGQFGGAIYVGRMGDLQFSSNESISFTSNNVIPNPMNAANGGAICVEGETSFQNNGDVTFSKNEARSQGGAIALDRKRDTTTENSLVFKGNDSVTFSGNRTNNQLAGLGGAVYNILGNMELSHNGEVTFSSNTARATYMSQGGAIYFTANGGSGLTLNLSYNDSLSFIDNLSQSGNFNATDGNAHGGAILASGTAVILNSNGSLLFKGNKAYTTKTNWVAQGGAIRVGYDGALHIQNNGSVVFEDNKCQVGSTVKYNSIYADDSTVQYNGTLKTYKLDVKISAPEEGSVEFRDCAYIDVSQHEESSFQMNNKYTGEDGKEIAQTGDIIFTGEYMDSGDKTSEFKGTASLHDGRLIVKNGAVLKTGELEIADSASGESTPTLVVQEATLSASALTFADSTALEYVTSDADTPLITISESLTLGADMTVTLGISGSVSGDTMKVAVAQYTGSESGWFTEGTNTKFSVDSLLWDITDLKWAVEDNTVYVEGTATMKDEVVIDNQDVTLQDEKGLGTGSVTTKGEVTITTGDNVVTELSEAITNEGNLTMEGSFDGSELTSVTVDETRVGVDGKEGNNGFYRAGGTALVVVNNEGEASLTVGDNTTVTDASGEELQLYASGLAAGKLDYSDYHIVDADHTASVTEIMGTIPEGEEEARITMTDGVLVADASATKVQSEGGRIQLGDGATVGGDESEIGGTTAVEISDGAAATLTGDNSYTGNTTITGATLTVGSDKALGESTVLLQAHGTLDLAGNAVSNDVVVSGCTLCNADKFTGNIDITSEGDLELHGNATANQVTLHGAGSIAQSPNATEESSLTANAVEMASGATGSIDAPLTINDGGTIILNDGSVLTVTGTLTLGEGTTFVLNGQGYETDSLLATAADGVTETTGRAVLSNGYGTYVAADGEVRLVAIFNQSIADAVTISNWGIATASRAFVDTVRGQRTNTGCIANGRGTAWAAVLGGNHDINGSDISLKGAAVGADVKVGEKSNVGIALGYIDGDVSPTGLRSVDQTGTYVALYGEHGLRKLSPTSCLSVDWVAAYGNTESDWNGTEWEQDSLQLNTRLNWNKKVTDRLCMSVFGGLEYFASNSDTVDSVKTGSIQNLRGELGVGARYVAWGAPGVYDGKGGLVSPGCEKLVLHGELRYMNDMVRSNPVIRMDGLSGSGANPGRQGMGIEVGATYRIGERWSASANYGFNAMDDSREHRVNVGASYTF